MLLIGPDAHAQAVMSVHRDIISGRVTNDSARALAGVEVIISRAPDRAFLRTITDSSGHYSIVFEQGTGDYLVHVSAPGMTTVRKRVTRQGDDSVFVVAVMLQPGGAEELAAVHVRAQRTKPSRHEGGSLSGTMEHAVDGVRGSVALNESGSIAAMAATVPAVLVTRDGVSAGGVGSAQNSTTLNGMSFFGADLPRDAVKSVTVRTSIYDPADGWFGGVEQAVDLGGGFPLTSVNAHLTLDAPALQYTDRYSREIGQRFTNFNAGIGGGGSVPNHQMLEYNFGVQAGRRTSNGISLGSAPSDLLEQAGIARDSATRLLQSLRSLGVNPGRPGQRASNMAIFLGSIGSREYTFPTYKIAPTVWSITAYAKAARSDNIAAIPNATSSYSGRSDEDIASLQGHLSAYIRDVYLLDATTSISTSRTRATPDLWLPSGTVALESQLSDGTMGFRGVNFGGNSGLAQELTKSTWETAANIKLYPPGQAQHRVKIAADSRIDGWRQAGEHSLGGFTFNSIDQVEANTPTGFMRTLNTPTQSAATWNGFASIGDYWHKSDAFQLLYGVRLEGNRFLGTPAYNPAIETAFGGRTDFAPNRIHLSPRIGFTYTMHDHYASVPYDIGSAASGPTGFLRGGIGEFRSLMGPSLLGGVLGRNGLASGAQTISCVGTASPAPMWGLYSADPTSAPTDCVGGPAQRSFIDVSPSVELLDRSYTAPRSWRANLSYGSEYQGLVYSVEGAYSLNLNQPGLQDLNFANQVRFTTSDEGRPVYVSAASIVPGSGALVPTSARRDLLFGSVVDHVSTLRSANAQLTLKLAPDLDNTHNWFTSLAYTIADSRAITSGFDNTTFGSPENRSWARSGVDVRHRVVVQAGVSKGGLVFTMFSRLQSGVPYTPIVGSDVNGDGLINDRAFIFDPRASADPTLSTAMKTVLQTSQRGVRDCLVRQLGRPAAVNSCEGPWTASMNAQLEYTLKFPRTRQGASVTLALMNPLGGLDQLLHGEEHLHGWGTSAYPSSVLYNVRGFDSANQSYNYSVNPKFGDTRPGSGVARPPFGLTLDFRIDLAAPVDMQVADLLLKPGRNGDRGQKISREDIRHMYGVTNPDPFLAILQESDSLLLSRGQEDALTQAGDVYAAQRDTILTALSSYLAGIADQYSTREVVRRQDELIAALWDLGHTSIKNALPAILNRYQLKMLPYPARDFYVQPMSVTGMSRISH
ncbi:MAG: carboxypeptidase-like regulatory domain-containing protein [Gemmatimonadaceae bacterium]